jgi:hypothetical protein
VLNCVSLTSKYFWKFSKNCVPATNFKKCNRKDPKWKECVLEAGSDAISQLTRPFPEVNLPNLEPLVIQEVNVGTATGGVSLTQNYKNLTIFGLTGAKLEKLE